MKKKQNLVWIAIAVLLLAALYQSGALQSVVSGFLVKSISPVRFESNSANIEQSNFIIQLVLNGGSDALFFGEPKETGTASLSQTELETVSGEDVEKPLTISAERSENNMVVPIIPHTQVSQGDYVYRIEHDQYRTNTTSWSTATEKSNVIQTVLDVHFDKCQFDMGNQYLGFAWDEGGDYTVSCGLFGCTYATYLNIRCFYKTNRLKVSAYDLQNIQAKWRAKFTLNGKFQESVELTNLEKSKNFTYGNIQATNLVFDTTHLPPQVDPNLRPAWDVAYTKWLVVPDSTFGAWKGSYTGTKTLLSNVSFLNGNWGNKVLAEQATNDLFDMVLREASGSTYDLSNGQLEFPLDGSISPEFQITLKAAFVGIIRNVTEPQLVCLGSTDYLGKVNEYFEVPFRVKNIGEAGGITVTHSCPLSAIFDPNVPQTQYASGATKDYKLRLTSGLETQGSCYIEAYSSADPDIRSNQCAINYVVKPIELCGNGQCDRLAPYYENEFPRTAQNPTGCPEDCGSGCGNGQLDAGENCYTCPQDAGCEQGYRCDIASQSCVSIPTCPNGLIDSGETCENCKQDIETVLGAGACKEEEYPWLWVVLAISVIAIIGTGGGYLAFGRKKKKGKRRR